MKHYVFAKSHKAPEISWVVPDADVAVALASWLQEQRFEVRLSDESEQAEPRNTGPDKVLAEILLRNFIADRVERPAGRAS